MSIKRVLFQSKETYTRQKRLMNIEDQDAIFTSRDLLTTLTYYFDWRRSLLIDVGLFLLTHQETYLLRWRCPIHIKRPTYYNTKRRQTQKQDKQMTNTKRRQTQKEDKHKKKTNRWQTQREDKHKKKTNTKTRQKVDKHKEKTNTKRRQTQKDADVRPSERWRAGVETHFQEISWNLRPVVNGT